MGSRGKVLITAKVHDYIAQRLLEKGYEPVEVPAIDYATLQASIADAVGLIVTTRLKIDAAMLERAEKLEFIGRLGSGMELIDTAYAASKGIRCESSPEGNCLAVAEHVLGLILNLLNHISRSAAQVRDGFWQREANRGTELSGKTVGIYGYGNTGAALAALLAPFNVRVLAYDKFKTGFAHHYIEESNPGEIAQYADIISLHVPLTAVTHHLADTAFFTALERRPVFINACRGKVADLDAVIEALKNNQIRAAGLDVIENENLATLDAHQQEQLRFLTHDPDVIITPHIAGYSVEAYYKMAKIVLDKLGI